MKLTLVKTFCCFVVFAIKGVALSCFISANAVAQHDGHNHGVGEVPVTKARHSGTIVTSGNKDFEVVLNALAQNEKLQIYIYGSKPKAVAAATGSVIINYASGLTDTLALQKGGDAILYCNPSQILEKFTAHILIWYKNKEYPIIYYNEGIRQ
jgi:hypothetical protein